jgi:hypothetical protein
LLIEQRKTPKCLATFWGFALYLAVRSYLMVEHQITKIIRFGDRYDFTLRLVPVRLFLQLCAVITSPNLKNFVIDVFHQISILIELCLLLRVHFLWLACGACGGISVTGAS